MFTKQQLPGIGASLGLDRLLAAMEELKMLPAAKTPAQVFIAYFDEVTALRLFTAGGNAAHRRYRG